VKINAKKYFRDRKNNLREVNMKYGRVVVFIRHDAAEIWGFRYGLTRGFGNLKIMASAGVFVLVVFALKHSARGHGRQPSIDLTYILLILLVNDSEYSESTGAKPILSRGCIYLVSPAAGKRTPLAVRPGLTRFTCASTFGEKKEKINK
jgi:hypothetical protein